MSPEVIIYDFVLASEDPDVWTVGRYQGGLFHPMSFHGTREAAAAEAQRLRCPPKVVDRLRSPEERIEEALMIAARGVYLTQSEHKDWIIRQMCEALQGGMFDDWLRQRHSRSWKALMAHEWPEGLEPASCAGYVCDHFTSDGSVICEGCLRVCEEEAEYKEFLEWKDVQLAEQRRAEALAEADRQVRLNAEWQLLDDAPPLELDHINAFLERLAAALGAGGASPRPGAPPFAVAVAMETAEGRRGGEWLRQTAEMNARETLVESISGIEAFVFEDRSLLCLRGLGPALALSSGAAEELDRITDWLELTDWSAAAEASLH